jgi:preprotein translocase subunit SecA
MRLQHGDETVGVSAASSGAGQAPDGQRLGRNDPCWCGSGKKFKRCHGS